MLVGLLTCTCWSAKFHAMTHRLSGTAPPPAQPAADADGFKVGEMVEADYAKRLTSYVKCEDWRSAVIVKIDTVDIATPYYVEFAGGNRRWMTVSETRRPVVAAEPRKFEFGERVKCGRTSGGNDYGTDAIYLKTSNDDGEILLAFENREITFAWFKPDQVFPL